MYAIRSYYAFAVAGDKASAETLLDKEVVHEDITLGRVIIGYSYQRANEMLAAINKKKDAHLANMREAQEAALTTSIWSTVAMFVTSTIAAIIGMIFLVRVVITTPLSRVVDASRRLADGDLKVRVENNHQDELGVLSSAFNEMAQRFHDVIFKLTDTTSKLADSAEHMAAIRNNFV